MERAISSALFPSTSSRPAAADPVEQGPVCGSYDSGINRMMAMIKSVLGFDDIAIRVEQEAVQTPMATKHFCHLTRHNPDMASFGVECIEITPGDTRKILRIFQSSIKEPTLVLMFLHCVRREPPPLVGRKVLQIPGNDKPTILVTTPGLIRCPVRLFPVRFAQAQCLVGSLSSSVRE